MHILYFYYFARRFVSRSDLAMMSLHVGSSQKNMMFLIMGV